MLWSVLKRVVQRSRSGFIRSQSASKRGAQVQAALEACQRGRYSEAESLCLGILTGAPDDAEVNRLLGHVYAQQQKYEEAATSLEKAEALRPGSPEALLEMGMVYTALGAVPRAISAYEAAVVARPGLPAAWNNLANLQQAAGDADGAELSLIRLLELEPAFANGHIELGNVLLRLGRPEEAFERYRRAVELEPDSGAANANFIYALHFHPGYSAEEISQAHRAWAQRVADPISARSIPPARARDPGQRLRIGYVSPDFRHHPVAYLVEPVLKHHDPARFDVVCYSDVARADAYTRRLQTYCTWRDTTALDDEALAQLVRSDGVDILVDLAGYTSGGRLLAFARMPAPIQITWAGYINTTGMRAMDYRISDANADPPGATEHLYSERLIRLPEIYMPFLPPDSTPLEAPPLREAGCVTFGSFNALQKVNASVIALWSRILQRLPRARLLVCTVPDGNAHARLVGAFAAHGVDADRLQLLPRMGYEGFLAAHRAADIALDPFPLCGAVTTCQTLWMGLPVVTLAGHSLYSRASASMLSQLGLAQLIASSPDEYVERAVALAQDPEALARLRVSLRERMLGSSLLDGPGFTRHLEAAYRNAWEEHCASPAL